MRCPKCGYISFDNVEICLNCNKSIADAAMPFLGSTRNVAVPKFLRFAVSEEDLEIEGAAEVDGDIEFSDPDLEILVDDEDQGDEIDFSMEEALSEELGEDEDQEELDLSADLGQFEDVPEQEDEETFTFADQDESPAETAEAPPDPALAIPDELADISDLSPPEPVAAESPDSEEVAAAPEDKLDLSSLDMEFDIAGLDDELPAPEAAEQAEEERPPESDMDEDLDFNLDLGGLTISENK